MLLYFNQRRQQQRQQQAAVTYLESHQQQQSVNILAETLPTSRCKQCHAGGPNASKQPPQRPQHTNSNHHSNNHSDHHSINPATTTASTQRPPQRPPSNHPATTTATTTAIAQRNRPTTSRTNRNIRNGSQKENNKAMQQQQSLHRAAPRDLELTGSFLALQGIKQASPMKWGLVTCKKAKQRSKPHPPSLLTE